MEKLKYVSPEYQAQLDRLAETLCTPERFAGQTAVQATLFEFPTLTVVPGPEAA